VGFVIVAYRFVRVLKLNTELAIPGLEWGVKEGNLFRVVYIFCSRMFVEEYRYYFKVCVVRNPRGVGA
jgi:hypothetical protein